MPCLEPALQTHNSRRYIALHFSQRLACCTHSCLPCIVSSSIRAYRALQYRLELHVLLSVAIAALSCPLCQSQADLCVSIIHCHQAKICMWVCVTCQSASQLTPTAFGLDYLSTTASARSTSQNKLVVSTDSSQVMCQLSTQCCCETQHAVWV